MGVSQVVIIGRPNVGKSSLFNWLVGKRLAIVDPTAGVTRDRMTELLEIGDHLAELVDTGGIGVNDVDDLTSHIEEQIQMAIESADVILFVVETRDGMLPLDEEVDRRLRSLQTPILCVVNKTDHEALDSQADEFHRFGHPLVRVSTQQNRGREELLNWLEKQLSEVDSDSSGSIEDAIMKVAIVGRRNVGKSTLVNTLVDSERMITSEVPGTTRDSVNIRFEMDGKVFLAIDTPGFRRKKSVSTDIDFYSTHRAQRSIRMADVVLLFFDAGQQIGKVDKCLCDYIVQQYKPCLFVVNKWDLLAEEMPTERWADYLRDTFRTMWHVPIAFITGKAGRNVKKLFNHAQMLYKQSRSRVSTAMLNKLVRAAIENNPPPLHHHHRPKIYYATQVATQPPTIVLFCNSPQALSQTYRRYLLGVFRDELEFGEVPIKLYFRKRESQDSTNEVDAKVRR